MSQANIVTAIIADLEKEIAVCRAQGSSSWYINGVHHALVTVRRHARELRQENVSSTTGEKSKETA
jgi:hypothetical protein